MQELNQNDWKSQQSSSAQSVILDVRTAQECEEGIIPGARMIDIRDGANFLAEIEKLDKSVDHFVYCRSGARSAQACMLMDAAGFKSTHNLIGGFMNWSGDKTMP